MIVTRQNCSTWKKTYPTGPLSSTNWAGTDPDGPWPPEWEAVT